MNNANRGLTDLIQSQASLARSLSSATDEIIFSEVLCAVYPELREARQEYRQQAAVAMILNEFARFVWELAEPPMAKRLDWSRYRVGDTLLTNEINGVQYTVSQNLPGTLVQMGFEFSGSHYFHSGYDFAVYFGCTAGTWSVDATKISWLHFFRKFFKHIENQTYERAEMGYRRDEL